MRKFYEVFSKEKLTPMVSKLSWSHYLQLLPIKNADEIIYYINLTLNHNLNKRQLQNKIKSNEYSRLSEKARIRIKDSEKMQVTELIPNPIPLIHRLKLENPIY